jgi:hypothetical protein
MAQQEHDKSRARTCMARTWEDHGKTMARAWQHTWQERANNMARAWQEQGKNTAMCLPWYCYGWSCHALAMFLPCSCHLFGMILLDAMMLLTWSCLALAMFLPRSCHGDLIAMSLMSHVHATTTTTTLITSTTDYTNNNNHNNNHVSGWGGSGRARQEHGKNMARARQEHGKSMAQPWQEDGNIMTRHWQ